MAQVVDLRRHYPEYFKKEDLPQGTNAKIRNVALKSLTIMASLALTVAAYSYFWMQATPIVIVTTFNVALEVLAASVASIGLIVIFNYYMHTQRQKALTHFQQAGCVDFFKNYVPHVIRESEAKALMTQQALNAYDFESFITKHSSDAIDCRYMHPHAIEHLKQLFINSLDTLSLKEFIKKPLPESFRSDTHIKQAFTSILFNRFYHINLTTLDSTQRSELMHAISSFFEKDAAIHIKTKLLDDYSHTQDFSLVKDYHSLFCMNVLKASDHLSCGKTLLEHFDEISSSKPLSDLVNQEGVNNMLFSKKLLSPTPLLIRKFDHYFVNTYAQTLLASQQGLPEFFVPYLSAHIFESFQGFLAHSAEVKTAHSAASLSIHKRFSERISHLESASAQIIEDRKIALGINTKELERDTRIAEYEIAEQTKQTLNLQIEDFQIKIAALKTRLQENKSRLLTLQGQLTYQTFKLPRPLPELEIEKLELETRIEEVKAHNKLVHERHKLISTLPHLETQIRQKEILIANEPSVLAELETLSEPVQGYQAASLALKGKHDLEIKRDEIEAAKKVLTELLTMRLLAQEAQAAPLNLKSSGPEEARLKIIVGLLEQFKKLSQKKEEIVSLTHLIPELKEEKHRLLAEIKGAQIALPAHVVAARALKSTLDHVTEDLATLHYELIRFQTEQQTMLTTQKEIVEIEKQRQLEACQRGFSEQIDQLIREFKHTYEGLV